MFSEAEWSEFHHADSWIRRESAARAVGRGNVKFHQKSMDLRRENLMLSSMGWSAAVREVWVAGLIRRPRGDGGRFRRPWSGGVGCLWWSAFLCVVYLCTYVVTVWRVFVRWCVQAVGLESKICII